MKTVGNRIAFCICAIGVITGVGILRATGPEPVIGPVVRGEDPSEWAVREKSQAIVKVREILGVLGREDLQTDAEIVLLAEDNSPFLSGQVIGCPVWHVVISGWKLELKSAPPDAEDSYARTFDIFLGAEDGRLLKIVSRWPEGVAPIPPEPGPASYTDQMRRAGNEKYHGFADQDPPISFLDALDGVFTGGRNPLLQEQIVGQCVIWSRMGRAPKPVWVITLRGTRALCHSTFPGIGINARNHIRCIVDAQTGRLLCGGTTPQPMTLEGKPTRPKGP